ncbi:hypothetical protein BDV24DRAFT_161075 [Aspergillus arachidicola]|uniref:Uncharacterized protein n=1 Tax=Aspergillus arachidicola TaxID=656916 RepID=A0A5N6YGX3_9EURO|nr:hypothetical protein BDV24DRAFT_161075 [Aspergillus arachidicola]
MSQASAEAAPPDEEDDLLDELTFVHTVFKFYQTPKSSELLWSIALHGMSILSTIAKMRRASDHNLEWSRLDYPMFIEVGQSLLTAARSPSVTKIRCQPTSCSAVGLYPLLPARNASMMCQQLVRMDPAYYYWYVVLRPDQCWSLISYPYYAKYARKGDPTF